MTPLLSNRQNTVNNYSSISTHSIHTYISPHQTPIKRVSYLSWILLVSPGPNKTLVATVYKKPTHTDQYLHWDSNYFISAKSGVFNTLAFRTKVVCSNPQTLQQEKEHIRKTLLACKFPLGPQQSTCTI